MLKEITETFREERIIIMFKKIRKVATNITKPRKRFVETKYTGTSTNHNRNTIITWQYAGYAGHIDTLTR